jgi:DNA-binding LytR/AlgR family response regulator
MYLKMLCEQIPNLEIVKSFDSPMNLLNEIKSLEFDFCIMDIEMPGINGIELSQKLKSTPVIFTTAYKDYAVEAFELNAIDYIQKPVQKERLEVAIQKAFKRIEVREPDKEYILINSDKGRILLCFKQINYITISENDSRDKIVYLDNNQKITLKNISFEKLYKQLPEKYFCQINKKDLIALKVVQHFSFDEISIFLNSDKIELKLNLSDVFRSEFIKKIAN